MGQILDPTAYSYTVEHVTW